MYFKVYQITKLSLQELNLNGNEEIDITTLQHQIILTKLSLGYCNLVNIDALRPLITLKYLTTVVGPRNAFLNQEEE
ncbi:Leucine-rich_repeat domain superfamily [Hexamita inflata]|uniref:Leucine-rich_repeat domain superfamily n=1 Tax=Hexamita inflata TaxID=28002 RepID=A0ABP1I7C8_9EUKA